MKIKKVLSILLISIFSMSLFIGCGKDNKVVETSEVSTSVEESSTTSEEENLLDSVEVVPDEIKETTSNKEEETSEEKEVIEEYEVEETNEEINVLSSIDESTCLPKVEGFKNMSDFNFGALREDETFNNYVAYVSNELGGNGKLVLNDDSIVYYNKENSPGIEMYAQEDYYAIFLYCVLNDKAEQPYDDANQIRMNQNVLKSMLNMITNDSDKVYEAIYNDYEIDSTINNESFTSVGNANIKSEALQKFVIYYISKN